MLVELHIHDYALVDRLELEFGAGLNVLTGETGAGKSIVIDAVSAVLGGRVSSEEVRQGRERALLEASFTVDRSTETAAALRELDLWEDDGQVILSREIAAVGRSKCRINGRLANVSHLLGVGEGLVDIHGQHDHQSLLSPSRHLELLDALGGEDVAQLRSEVARLAGERTSLMQKIERLRQGERDRLRREDLLTYQIEEIRAAEPQPEEDEHLAREKARLGHVEKLAQGVQEAYLSLYEGDGRGTSAVDLVGAAFRRLEGLAQLDENLDPLVQAVGQALVGLQEAAHDLRRYSESLTADPARLDEVEERLESLAKLKRKYGESVAEVLAFCREAEASLTSLTSTGVQLDQLEREQVTVDAALTGKATALSSARRRVADDVSQRIRARLAELNMPNVSFGVSFDRDVDPTGLEVDGTGVRVTRSGIDRVEFLFSANPGERPRPLAKIASGGEMSRVMLAIKATLAEVDPSATLIFDEVDSGIGGRTAERVADALSALSRTHQVLVVTHLAQIAARADRHFLVEKAPRDDRTSVAVRCLNGDNRIREIARMLDGTETPTSFEHAKALLDLAGKTKTAS